MGQQVAMAIEISLWLPWGTSYHSNKICGTCLLFQETLVPNISSIWLKTNKLLMFQSGCHGNWVTIAMRYAADAFISKNLHSKYKLNITWKGIMETSLWLLWQWSYYSNEVCGLCLLSQGISLPNMNSIGLTTKKLWMFHFGCHGNQVSIAMRYEADAYCPSQALCQLWTQYNITQINYWHITVVAMVT